MRTSFWEGLVVGLLVGAGLVWTSPWLAERLAYWQAPVVELHPAVAVYPPAMRLTNQDSFEWKDVRLVLDAPAAEAGYTFRLAHVPAGAQVEFALESFTAPDGRPFDPRTTKAFFLALQAETPQGRGVWSGRLD
jgi:hypothetical protein